VRLSDAAALGSVIHLRAHPRVLGRVLVVFGVANLACDLAVLDYPISGITRARNQRRTHPSAVLRRLGIEPFLDDCPLCA